MKALQVWLLGGALAASLSWNWTLHHRAAVLRACSQRCEVDCADLELGASQRAALDDVCARSCGESDRLELRADELQSQLLASLSAGTVDAAEARKLVDEVSELRRRSLAACVEGILDVRKVLTGEQVRLLLERCQRTNCK